MKKYRFLKLVGIALLTMVTLVIISVLEVAVYSYVINPGQGMPVYDEHANVSAPWISCIFGFIIFFLVVRYWGRKNYEDLLKLAVFFALTYIGIDLIIMISFGVNWAEFYPIVLMANGAKVIGALMAYYFYKPKGEGS